MPEIQTAVAVETLDCTQVITARQRRAMLAYRRPLHPDNFSDVDYMGCRYRCPDLVKQKMRYRLAAPAQGLQHHADSNMIAVIIEGGRQEHPVGLIGHDNFEEPCFDHGVGRKCPIRVAKQFEMIHTQLNQRCLEFLLPQSIRPFRQPAGPASVGQQHHLHLTPGSQQGQRPAAPQRLIIRMRCEHQNSPRFAQVKRGRQMTQRQAIKP